MMTRKAHVWGVGGWYLAPCLAQRTGLATSVQGSGSRSRWEGLIRAALQRRSRPLRCRMHIPRRIPRHISYPASRTLAASGGRGALALSCGHPLAVWKKGGGGAPDLGEPARAGHMSPNPAALVHRIHRVGGVSVSALFAPSIVHRLRALPQTAKSTIGEAATSVIIPTPVVLVVSIIPLIPGFLRHIGGK